MKTKRSMKYLIIFITCLSITYSCTTNKQPVSENEVSELTGKWLELWSSYDLDRLNDIFWDDPSMTYFSSEKRGLIKGYDQIKPHHESFGFVAGGKQPSKSLWLEDINMTLHDRTAVVEAIWYFGDKMLPKDSVQQGPVTFVMIKNKEDQVRIAHTHFGNYP